METVKTIKGYELHERIGSGGFGVVHRAYQATVGREVAIKIILPHFANDPDFIRRFETEAQLIARLEHPHIVPLYDYWRDPEGAYLVMRWLRGGNLRDALSHGPFGLEAAALFMDQMSSALALAHRNEIIHRDLKPANILLDEDGNAYLSDFGIAKDTGKADAALTETGMVLGSLDYLSPEQARSESVTPQTDIYSLGVVLYEVLTGQHPFPNVSSVERMYKHLNEPLPLIDTLPADIAEGINAIIQKATAKNPAHRYADVLAMSADFRRETALSLRSGENLVEQLTLREQEILQMILDGCSNKDIAQRLFITVSTVKWHIRQVYQKLRVRSRVQAIVRARELNLIGSDTTLEPMVSESTFVALPEPENPYKGLRAFQVADARDFFGRERLIQRLVKRLGEHDKLSRFLAVLGPSGSGKSSVVKAGLVPALWRGDLPGSEHWFVVEMVPGAHPLDELEIALTRVAANQAGNLREHLERDARGLVRVAGLIFPDDGSDLVIIVDQFEEVFTLVDDGTKRTHFLDLLHTAVTDPRSRVRVIITLRADFYDRPLHYPDFGEMVRSRMETVLPLSADELEAAITRPASRVGVSFEPGLVATITSDVHYQPGALPLLQYALTELFEQRDNHTLTHEAYQSLGGAAGALAKRAEELYHEQDEGGQEAIRQMFLRLVSLGEGAEDTRRRVARSELLAVAGNEDLMDESIDMYAAYRLLTLDHDPLTRSPTVEIAHEAILSEWERLRSWLNDCRHDIRQQRLLAAAATEWFQAERDPSYLLTGSRLSQFEGWAGTTQVALTQNERTYLEVSVAERQHQEDTERERQTHELELAQQAAESARQAEHAQRSAAHRLRYLVMGLVVFLAAAIVLTFLALDARSVARNERNNAQRQRDNAQLSANESLSLALASGAREAVLKNDPDLALALAVEANAIPQSPSQVKYTLADIAFAPGTRRIFTGHTSPIEAVAVSPDGRYMLTGSGRVIPFVPREPDNTMRLWDLQTGMEVQRFEGHSDSVWSVAFSPDGQTAFSGSADGSIIHWDLLTGEELHRYAGVIDFPVIKIAVSPDGQMIVEGDYNGGVYVFDVETGKEKQRLLKHTGVIDTLAFSPDSRTLFSVGAVTGSSIDSVIVWNVMTGQEIRRFEIVYAVLSSGLHLGPNDYGVAISSDGQMALGIQDNELVLCSTETGSTIRRFDKEHNGLVTSIAISPDGRTALTASDDTTLIYWDLTTGKLIRRLSGHQGAILAVTFTPDGLQAVTVSTDMTARLWDLNSAGEVRQLSVPGFDQMYGLAISLDGLTALSGVSTSAGDQNAMILWDLQSGTEIQRFEGFGSGAAFGVQASGGIVYGITYSPDGQTAFSASEDRGIRLWDLHTGAEIRRHEMTQVANTVSLSPDNTKIVVYGGMFLTHILDAQTWALLQTLGQPSGAGGMWDVISDGRTAILGNDQLGIQFVDIETGITLYTLTTHTSVVNAVRISSDGRYALSGGADRFIILSDLVTKSEVRRFLLPTKSNVTSLDFSPDGRMFVSGHSDGSLILWDMADDDPLARYEGHYGPIFQVRFGPDGQAIFSTGLDGTLRQWALPPHSTEEWITWALSNRFVRELTDIDRAFYGLAPEQNISAIGRLQGMEMVSPTPAPSLIATAAPVSTATLQPQFEAQIGENRGAISPAGNQVWAYTGHRGDLLAISAIADSSTTGVYDPAQQVERSLLDTWLIVRGPDGSILAQNDDADGSRDNNARVDLILPDTATYIIQVRSAQDRTSGPYSLIVLPIQMGTERSQTTVQNSGVWGVAISPDSKLALSSRGGTEYFTATGQSAEFTPILWSLDNPEGPRELYRLEAVGGHQASATCIAFSPDGKTMLSGAWDSTIVLWDVQTGQMIRQFSHQTALVENIAYSPDGKTALSISYDGTVRHWDLATGEELHRFELGSPGWGGIAFSPDGTNALAGSTDGYVFQWNLKTGQEIHRFLIHEAQVSSVMFSPDGRRVVSGDTRGNIIMWDATTGQEIRRFRGHTTVVSSLMSTQDGHLVSASWDRTIRLWDAENGQELIRFVGHEKGVYSAMISHDGHTMVSGSFDGTMRVWDVPELPGEVK